MDSTDPGAGEHGDRQLRNHRHIKGDAVPFFNPQVFQNIGERIHAHEQCAIGDAANLIRFVSFPNDGNPVAQPILNMPIETIDGDIGLGPFKPFDIDFIFEVVLPNFIPFLIPDKIRGDFSPKTLRVFDGTVPLVFIILKIADNSLFSKRFRRWKLPLFLQDGFNRFGHDSSFEPEVCDTS